MTANIVIDTAQSVLNQTPKALNRVGVNVSHDIDLFAVIDATVNVASFSNVGNTFVPKMFVSENNALRRDVFFNHRQQNRASRSFARKRSDFAFALDQANDHLLVFPVPAADAASAAKIRLIDFYALAVLAANRIRFVIGKHRANLLEYAPCGFVRDSRFPLNLLRGNPAASRGHEVDRIEPRRERSGRLMKDRLRRGMEMIAAVVARVRRATRHAMMFGFLSALVAERHLVGMEAAKEPIKTRRVVGKLFTEVVDCVRLHVRFAVVVWHSGLPTTKVAEYIPTVKGYLPKII